MHRFRAALLSASALLSTAALAQQPSLAVTYKSAADKLIADSLADTEGYANLAYLCDHIGKRITGGEPLGRAVAWSADLMRRDGLANVTVQPVMVPHWVRGHESASIVEPVAKPMHMLGLGMSVATPVGGITAPVVVVKDFDELKKLGRAGVAGKIVLYNVAYKGYGQTVMYRVAGPSQAAALGAVATLVRSITPLAVQLPHTGVTSYDEKQPKIPAAAISLEDALMLERLAAEGKPPVVHLDMEAHMEAEVESANVFGEIVGSEHPEQVVTLGGHIDSWDVGQGAQDDGSGIMATLEAVNVIKRSGLKPKRTIRIVFWVSEENGGVGGQVYLKKLTGKLEDHVAVIEMDGGAEQPVGYGYGASFPGLRAVAGGAALAASGGLSAGEQRSLALLQQIGTLLKPVGADTMRAGGGGSDIEPMMGAGVPGLGEMTTGAHYFDWHHTEADTLDKVDPQDFRKNIASLSVMTYILADMPERLAGHKGAGEE
ncbi:Peptidase family M28 [Granulicella rosea]|uniref:Carboxypeptidase Q n=1 Tax=Granulicella rosea TaxID=474952 RepID=A0A239CUM5_9BACT|nr:M20/M25/M40 family metallo-hydrolase [Granulicella rosea]SNS23053.1 Peptidase family M28 [Granulicella rosea]